MQHDEDELFYEYMGWLMEHGSDYDLLIGNGDMLLEYAEKYIGYEDFLKEKGIDDL